MKSFALSIVLKIVLTLFSANFYVSATAQTLMTATANDGTVLSFTLLKDFGDDTELLVKKPQKKAKKYLMNMPTIDGQIRFSAAVICQRNCANAKPATPGLPLKGSYLEIGSELRCVKNCSGFENGLVFVAKR